MCNEIQQETSEPALLKLYSATWAEITRYRDREWRNQGVFTASMVGIIGFIITHEFEVRQFVNVLDAALILLVLGNVFYTSYAHHRLTQKRKVIALLNKRFKFHEIKVDEEQLLKPESSKWMRGAMSHLLPFFILDIWLAYVGIYFLHSF